MAREFCKDCGEPRGSSHSASYCRKCHNKRQRQYARDRAEAQGHKVKARIEDQDAQDRVMAGDAKPGSCDLCGSLEELGLVMVYRLDTRPPDPNEPEVLRKVPTVDAVPVLLSCQPCADLVSMLEEAAWVRLRKIMWTLSERALTRDVLMIDKHRRKAPSSTTH